MNILIIFLILTLTSDDQNDSNRLTPHVSDWMTLLLYKWFGVAASSSLDDIMTQYGG